MARLRLSPTGLGSPLDVGPTTVSRTTPPGPADAPAGHAPDVSFGEASVTTIPVAHASSGDPAATAERPAPREAAAAPAEQLPEWAVGLDPRALQPDRLLGRPRQTALILDRELSERADALVAATGPRVTFAGIVAAILHFRLPADPADAAGIVGAYRRRRLDALDHPWEERNARIPARLRADLDGATAAAAARVAGVRRSTVVNALLDAHLPRDPDDAARLVTRMEMVRGGAFLDAA